MNPTEQTIITNTYASIIEEVDEMFKALDQYRKLHREKKDAEAQKHLFKAHSHEKQARKMMNQEYHRQNPITQKTKAA